MDSSTSSEPAHQRKAESVSARGSSSSGLQRAKESARGTPDAAERNDSVVKEDRIVVGIPTYNEEIANEVGATVIRHQENTGNGGATRILDEQRVVRS